jgi:hypothetical protein
MINDDIFLRKFSLENDVVFGYCHFFNNKFVMKLQPKTLVKDSLCKLKDYLYFNSIIDIDANFLNYENVKACDLHMLCKESLNTGEYLGKIYHDELHTQIFFKYFFGEAQEHYITYRSLLNFFYMEGSNAYLYLEDIENENNKKKVYGDKPYLCQKKLKIAGNPEKTIYKSEPLIVGSDILNKHFQGADNENEALFFTRLIKLKRNFFERSNRFPDEEKASFLENISNKKVNNNLKEYLKAYFSRHKEFPDLPEIDTEPEKNALLQVLYELGIKAAETDSFLHIGAMEQSEGNPRKIAYDFTKNRDYHRFYETVVKSGEIRFYNGVNDEDFIKVNTDSIPDDYPYFRKREEIYGDYCTISDMNNKQYTVNIEGIYFDLENNSATWMYQITIFLANKLVIRKIIPEKNKEDKLVFLTEKESLTPSTDENNLSLKMNLVGDPNDIIHHMHSEYMLAKGKGEFDPFPFLMDSEDIFPAHHFFYFKRLTKKNISVPEIENNEE